MCVADTSHDPTNPKFQQYLAVAERSRRRVRLLDPGLGGLGPCWGGPGEAESTVVVGCLLCSFGCVPCLRIFASLAQQTLLEADQRGCEDAVHNDAAQADFAVHRRHECDKGECAAGMAWSPSRPVALRCFFSSLSARYPRPFDPICLCPRPALTMGLGRCCNSISRTRITTWTPPSTSRCTFFCFFFFFLLVLLCRACLAGPSDGCSPPLSLVGGGHAWSTAVPLGLLAGWGVERLGAESRSWEYGRGTRG